MTLHQDSHRAPFPAHLENTDKRHTGRTGLRETQVELRTNGHRLGAPLTRWVYERLGRQLGKFAPQIERVEVRFEDLNGPRGGVDKTCMVHVILSRLPPVIVEERGETSREAFDRAAGRAERATRRNLERHGFSTRHKTAKSGAQKRHGAEQVAEDGASDLRSEPTNESLYGRRVGKSAAQLALLAARPEKLRRDLQVDTAADATAAHDRKVGYGHTGARNTKLHAAGAAYALEDSTSGRPSRKSTRGGAQRQKSDSPLTQRTRCAVQSPQHRADRNVPR